MDDRGAYIALNMMQGVGPVTVRALVAALGSPARILAGGEEELLGAPGVGKEIVRRILDQRGRADPDREVARMTERGGRILTPVDEEYPRPLRDIYDPPLSLYVEGNLESKDRHAIAVVGTRHATHYGLEMAERLGFQLAKCGFTVVSGLARGIDTAAHRGALKGAGRTLAVLGGAVDRLYPPENADLAREIVRSGAVLSEFLLGREPDKTTFPMRNRLISGLSLGVVVVEASPTSGAMITATQALEQGRTVFAVPGRVDNGGARGPHQLLKSGARLVEDVEDILQEFQSLLPREKAPGQVGAPRPVLTSDEQAIVAVLERENPADLDTITRETGLGAAKVSAVVIGLEMKRVVRMLPGRQVGLAPAGHGDG